MNKVLLIGGTDPSGAGLQTDWKVINTLEVSAHSIVTAVTAQNNSGVQSDGVLPFAQIKAQFDALKGLTFSAIKIGMLGNEHAVKAVVNYLERQAGNTPVILDPVLSASSGDKLLSYAGQRLMLAKLFPYVTLLTPNLDEITRLSNLPCKNPEQIHRATQALFDLGIKSALIKGGHSTNNDQPEKCTDTFISPSSSFYLVGNRWLDKTNVRGTGCVLATAIASYLALGHSLIDAVVLAKALVSQGIKQAVVSENTDESSIHHFHFTKNASGSNFNLTHLPQLRLNPEEHYPKFSPCDTHTLGIYPVIDSIEWLKKLVLLGIKTIQLRIKDKQDNEVETDIIEAIAFCREHAVRLFINDYWQLAIKHRAYGIHLGQEDIATADLTAIANAGCRLGLSTHSYAEVARTLTIKPSYIALGPIFETTSKDMPWIPQGVDAVKHWVKLLGEDYPLVAIGGINFERATALKKTGIGSVAMISAITEAPDYKKATLDLLALWDSATEKD